MNDPHLGRFDLGEEIAGLPPGDDESGRRGKILFKTDRLRVVLMTLSAGAALNEHSVGGSATLQALRGEFVIEVAGTENSLQAGGMIAFHGGVEHTVRAVADGALLLTIAWDPAWRGEEGDSANLP